MKKTKKLLLVVLIVLITVFIIFVIKKDTAKAPDLTNNTTSRGDPIDSSQGVQESFDKSKYSLIDPASIWVIVNKNRQLSPIDYAPKDLVSIGGLQMRAVATEALNQLITAAKSEGLGLQAMSGYRSYARQQQVYQNEVKTYGQTVADTQSAKPGYSEHQTGLAMDIGGGGCGIENCFGQTREGKWVANNAHRFGFIIRYPEGKETVTGYRYEPWHIRYIGTELATEMKNQKIQTLEEFFSL